MMRTKMTKRQYVTVTFEIALPEGYRELSETELGELGADLADSMYISELLEDQAFIYLEAERDDDPIVF